MSMYDIRWTAITIISLSIRLVFTDEELPELAVPEQVHLSLTQLPDEMAVTWLTMSSRKCLDLPKASSYKYSHSDVVGMRLI